jgi:hypothetical protein
MFKKFITGTEASGSPAGQKIFNENIINISKHLKYSRQALE